MLYADSPWRICLAQKEHSSCRITARAPETTTVMCGVSGMGPGLLEPRPSNPELPIENFPRVACFMCPDICDVGEPATYPTEPTRMRIDKT